METIFMDTHTHTHTNNELTSQIFFFFLIVIQVRLKNLEKTRRSLKLVYVEKTIQIRVEK